MSIWAWVAMDSLAAWIIAILCEAGVPKGLRPWLQRPSNASKALHWLTSTVATGGTCRCGVDSLPWVMQFLGKPRGW